MADKYCDVSLSTGLNDGTSTANAWQSLVDVLDGTPTSGSYAAGDVIHIRTADSGGNLTQTATAAITTPEKTGSYPSSHVEWRFDDGTKWTESGTFEFVLGSNVSSWTISQGNLFNGGYSGTRRFEVKYNNNSANVDIKISSGAQMIGVHFTRGTSPGAPRNMFIEPLAVSNARQGVSLFNNCKFEHTTPEGGGTNPTTLPGVFTAGAGGYALILNSEIAMNSSITNDTLIPNSSASVSFELKFVGCKFTGTASTHALMGTTARNTAAVRIGIISFKDCDLGLIDEAQATYAAPNGLSIVSESMPGADFFRRTPYELIQYESTGNYPTLNATIPDSGTNWSIRVWPDDDNCGTMAPASLGSFTKWYNGTAATKTLTVELLIKDTSGGSNAFDSPAKNEWWVEFSYIDNSTSLPVVESTYVNSGGGLTTSTASWSSTTYGANSYDKYKLSLTTANSIKQYTFITALIFSNKPAGVAASSASGDFYFVDPDFSVT